MVFVQTPNISIMQVKFVFNVPAATATQTTPFATVLIVKFGPITVSNARLAV